MDELILVDLLDNERGTGEKLAVHEAKQLHRAFSLLVVCGDEMLIHQRALTKYHSGGLWTNACCSHPRKGEETRDAVVRRSEQELGLSLDGADTFEELYSFVYYADFGTLAEYEYDHVFLATFAEKPALAPDPDEVMDTAWVKLEELSRDVMANPLTYSAWFKTAYPEVLRRLAARS